MSRNVGGTDHRLGDVGLQGFCQGDDGLQGDRLGQGDGRGDAPGWGREGGGEGLGGWWAGEQWAAVKEGQG